MLPVNIKNKNIYSLYQLKSNTKKHVAIWNTNNFWHMVLL